MAVACGNFEQVKSESVVEVWSHPGSIISYSTVWQSQIRWYFIVSPMFYKYFQIIIVY